MKQFMPLLLQVWQETCRHTEIDEAVCRIAPLVARRLPLHRLTVLEIDPATQAAGVVAVAGAEGSMPRPWPRLDTETALDRLRQWMQRGEMVFGDDASLAEVCPGLTGDGEAGSAAAAPLRNAGEALGAVVFLSRPAWGLCRQHEPLLRALLEPLSVALQNDRRLRELRRLRHAAEVDKQSLLRRIGREDLQDRPIVGADQGLAPVMQRVGLVAPSNVPVLILGETGSGKEVIARAIHDRSPRQAGPFVRVNCGAIPPELMDSELFGHEKGAFTGASRARQGWFERSDGGTLLLDEVGELPPAAQVRLLRVVQDGTLERVGGERTIHVDVRIAAATHRDLAAMVQEGRFRPDLWYRIAVFPVVLPPLRERREDIPALAEHFARRAARRFGLRYCPPTSQDTALLQRYDWPGNIRELASVIDRAAILGDGQRLEIAKALGSPPNISGPAVTATTDSGGPLPPGPALSRAREIPTLGEVVTRHIEDALRTAHGRIEGPEGAAALLGINPSTLRSRIRKMGIAVSNFRRESGP